MRFLSPDQCKAWVLTHHPRLNVPDDRGLEWPGAHCIRFTTPADAGKRVALARLLWHAMSHRSEAMLWVTEWGVWGSSEHMPLNVFLRKAFGENRTLKEAPGHLFVPDEADAALSFLVVAILFLWDAYLLSAGGELAIFISHDEYCIVSSRDIGEGILLEKQLAAFIEPAT